MGDYRVYDYCTFFLKKEINVVLSKSYANFLEVSRLGVGR